MQQMLAPQDRHDVMPIAGFARVKLALVKDDLVLVLQKTNGQWDLPGGKVEDGESLSDALVRESLEELGVCDLQNHWALGQWLRQRPGRSPVLVHFFASVWPGKSRRFKLSDEHRAQRWVDADTLLSLDLPEGYRQAALGALAHIR